MSFSGNVLTPEIVTFMMTFSDCPCSTNSPIAISAANASEVCSDINASAFDQGCSLRPACVNGGSGLEMDIIGPFCSPICTNSSFSFLGGAVPAAATVVQITGLTDTAAAQVDFDAATGLDTLASQLDNIPGINVSDNATSLSVVASAPGARVFTGLSLMATPPQVISVNSFTDTGNGLVTVSTRLYR